METGTVMRWLGTLAQQGAFPLRGINPNRLRDDGEESIGRPRNLLVKDGVNHRRAKRIGFDPMEESLTRETCMAANSTIEWTERTWNPVLGCSIKSPGCHNCYAMLMARRLKAMALADIAAGREP